MLKSGYVILLKYWDFSYSRLLYLVIYKNGVEMHVESVGRSYLGTFPKPRVESI